MVYGINTIVLHELVCKGWAIDDSTNSSFKLNNIKISWMKNLLLSVRVGQYTKDNIYQHIISLLSFIVCNALFVVIADFADYRFFKPIFLLIF